MRILSNNFHRACGIYVICSLSYLGEPLKGGGRVKPLSAIRKCKFLWRGKKCLKDGSLDEEKIECVLGHREIWYLAWQESRECCIRFSDVGSRGFMSL